jgi:hypothetical protein
MNFIGELAALATSFFFAMTASSSHKPGNAILMLAAIIFVWAWTAFDGKMGATFAALRQRPHVLRLLALGLWLVRCLGSPLLC